MIEQIIDASEAMGNTKLVTSYAHFPCGGARKYGVTMAQQIELSLVGLGVLRVNLQWRGFTVTPYVHALYGAENGFDAREDETFEVDRDAWLEGRASFGDEISQLSERSQLLATAPA